MPDLGIGEGIAALLGGGGGLADLLGIGGADAAGIAGGAGAAAGADAAAGTTLADLVGTGTGLAGGATGLAGTELAGGVSAADIAGGAAFGTEGLGAAGTAADFLSAPSASAFNLAATTPGAAGFSTDSALASLTGTPTASAPTTGAGTTAIGGTPDSVFNTGANPVAGVGAQGQPAAVGASAVSAPSGVTPVGGVDPTAAAGQVAGATGPTSVGGAPVAGGSSSSSISDLLSKAGGGALDSLTKNPLGIGLGAAGLGYSIYSGMQQTANQKALTADAATATANSTALENQGQGLVNYLTSGTLPPQYQTQITQAINSAIATAKSNAAAQGLPTDPTKNTALAAQIAEINNQQPILQEQIAQQLAGTGTSLINAGAGAAGLSGSLYSTLVQNDTTQAANAGKAIATLAAALNGKSSNSVGGINISTG